jgi:hypothetical protein
MELDVTHMVNDADNMPMLSGSRAELGQDAGAITWNNSKAYAAENLLLTDDTARQQARDFFKGFGAWSEEEIAAWTDLDLEALVCQFIAGDIREMEGYETETEYREASEQGQVSGHLYTGDNGRWYFYLGD